MKNNAIAGPYTEAMKNLTILSFGFLTAIFPVGGVGVSVVLIYLFVIKRIGLKNLVFLLLGFLIGIFVFSSLSGFLYLICLALPFAMAGLTGIVAILEDKPTTL